MPALKPPAETSPDPVVSPPEQNKLPGTGLVILAGVVIVAGVALIVLAPGRRYAGRREDVQPSLGEAPVR